MFWDTKPEKITGDILSDIEILRGLPPFAGALVLITEKGSSEDTVPGMVWHNLTPKRFSYFIYGLILKLVAIDPEWALVIGAMARMALQDQDERLRLKAESLVQAKVLHENPITDL